MYTNLLENLQKKGISINAAALAIGMPEATFRTKIQDRSFYVEEAFNIKENLFPELDFKYLFKKS
ncbi:MAG: XRE family transcriptional regulator [Ruminococcus sp.]|nr:XRE family transcriptional regulator [Ruminococcus sp.]MCM1380383.1 XRE family transcriptional regulator [Muribaculaceae bacterium]MCM1478307.1 XRE family transcriptional regulator [Muribaculaceae bacterium]